MNKRENRHQIDFTMYLANCPLKLLLQAFQLRLLSSAYSKPFSGHRPRLPPQASTCLVAPTGRGLAGQARLRETGRAKRTLLCAPDVECVQRGELLEVRGQGRAPLGPDGVIAAGKGAGTGRVRIAIASSPALRDIKQEKAVQGAGLLARPLTEEEAGHANHPSHAQ